MRDYAVLINALKAMSNTNSCFYCQGEHLVCEANGCILSNAADAIEELLAERTAFWVDTQPHLEDFSYKKDGMSYYCSNCHHRAGKYKHRSYKFCPWCGAKIVPKEMAVRNED